MIGSCKPVNQGQSQLKKQYQIDKQRAPQRFRKQAGASGEEIQFALPLPEVLKLVQQGLINLAMGSFQEAGP